MIISNAYGYWEEDSTYLTGNSYSDLTYDSQVKTQVFRDGLKRTVHKLHDAGHQVHLIQDVPAWSGASSWDLTSCSLVSIVRDGCFKTRSLQEAVSPMKRNRRTIIDVAAQTDAIVWDPILEICSSTECSSQADEGFPRYRDGDHLSVPQSLALANSMKKALGNYQGSP